MWIIECDESEKTEGERLFWSERGWGSLEGAVYFTDEQKARATSGHGQWVKLNPTAASEPTTKEEIRGITITPWGALCASCGDGVTVDCGNCGHLVV